MAFFTLLMSVDVTDDYHFEPLALVYVLFTAFWGLGIYLQYFEYKRGMPHAWYAHQLFWILNAVLSAATLVAVLIFLDAINIQSDKFIKIKYLVCTTVSLLVSTTLAVMGIKYKRECPQHLRNYLSTPIAAVINEPLI